MNTLIATTSKIFVALAVLVAIPLSGCGGGSDSVDPATTQSVPALSDPYPDFDYHAEAACGEADRALMLYLLVEQPGATRRATAGTGRFGEAESALTHAWDDAVMSTSAAFDELERAWREGVSSQPLRTRIDAIRTFCMKNGWRGLRS